jgi:pyrroline-5-carboxylate reductase
MKQTIGFIGCGNMAQAMIGGILKNALVPTNQMIVSNRSLGKLENFQKDFPIRITTHNREVAKAADILFLAVKPNVYPQVISEIKDDIKDNVLIINIAAGVTLQQTEALFGKTIKVIKAMPNTPSLVGEGMAGLCSNNEVNSDEREVILQIFQSFGRAQFVDESLMDAVTAVSGSAPAYVYLFIEAMADAAVKEGMPRAQAYQFAAQTVRGAAQMVLETGKHPGELKDQVCSPGGTTIEAVTTLEKTGFRQSVIAAMETCSQKSKKMTQK